MHRLKENSGKGRGRDKKRGLEEEGMKKAIRDKGGGMGVWWCAVSIYRWIDLRIVFQKNLQLQAPSML